MCLDTTEISAAEKNYSTPFMFRAKSESVFIDSPFFFQVLSRTAVLYCIQTVEVCIR